jgi:hypothetical protein
VFTQGIDVLVNYQYVAIPNFQSDIGILVCGLTTQGLPFSNPNPAGSEGLLCIPRMKIAFKSTTVALKKTELFVKQISQNCCVVAHSYSEDTRTPGRVKDLRSLPYICD